MAPLTPEEITRRDRLARQRTLLANERTFLSYIRTSASMFLLGAGLIHFVVNVISNTIGWIVVGAGTAILLVGLARFLMRRQLIRQN